MKTQLYKAADRGTKDIGWLVSKFVLSFSEFADPTRTTFGTLVAFNDDLVAPGKGFGIHPHGNMEIISVLLQGKMNHKDNMGYSTEIEAGGVQIMSAGTGLFHEEYNIGTEEVNFLQIWIQPKLQNIKPRYQKRDFPKAKRTNQLTTLVSNEEGLAHCWINQNTKILIGYFTEQHLETYSFKPANKCVFIYAINGSISVDGIILQSKDGLGIWDTDTIHITSEPNSEYLIIETPVNQK